MLVELRVRNLGVIADLELELGPGMTAVTGETGAGKTLVVDAIELLVGGRADPAMVRAGEDEAVVEGRFVVDGQVTANVGEARRVELRASAIDAALVRFGPPDFNRVLRSKFGLADR